MTKKWILIESVLLLLACQAASATIIAISDPVGDHTGSVDVTGMTLTIDETSGAYTIEITADSANPFIGDFRINVNLFNATLDEFFQNTFNDYSLSSATTSIWLSGADIELSDWLPSHSIATSTYAGLGNPSGISLFRSSVGDLPLAPICVSEDIIGVNGCLGTNVVPEPSTLALFGLGLFGLGFASRRKMRMETL